MRHDSGLIQARSASSDDVFGQVFGDFFGFHRRLRRQKTDTWMPPTDVYETQGDIVIKMSLPGVRTADIDIRVDGDTITIAGIRRPNEGTRVVCYHQMEIRNGYFERTVAIHKPFDPERITAHYEDGFLRVVVPRADKPLDRRVTIKVQF